MVFMSANMEFLKRVPAVKGLLVVLVIWSAPSGHIVFRYSLLELKRSLLKS